MRPTSSSSPPARGRSALLAGGRPRPSPSASSGSRCWPPCPGRSTSARWSTARWRPSSTRCSRDLPSWNEDDFLAPYEIETGNWMLQLVSQRANGETLLGCPMDYPAEVTHDVTLTGLRDTALAIIDDFPGPARRRHRPHVGRRAAVHVRPASRSSTRSPGPVRRRRPHLRQRRRADDRQARQPAAGRPRSRRSTCPRAAGSATSSRSPPGDQRALVSSRTGPRTSPTSTAPCATRSASSSIARSCRRSPSASGPTTTRPTCCPRSPSSACSACRSRPSTAGSELDLVGYALVFEELARGWMGLASVVGSSQQRLLADRPLRHGGAAATATSPTSPPAGA